MNSMKHSTPSVSTFLHADPANASIITQCGGIPLVIQCLSSPVRNTVSISEAKDTITLVPPNSVHVVLVNIFPSDDCMTGDLCTWGFVLPLQPFDKEGDPETRCS